MRKFPAAAAPDAPQWERDLLAKALEIARADAFRADVAIRARQRREFDAEQDRLRRKRLAKEGA